MESCQQKTRHEKSLLEQTELKSEGILLEEVSTYEKTKTGCKRMLEEGILDREEKNVVKFQQRMARKMFKKAQEKLVQIYDEDESESDSD